MLNLALTADEHGSTLISDKDEFGNAFPSLSSALIYSELHLRDALLGARLSNYFSVRAL